MIGNQTSTDSVSNEWADHLYLEWQEYEFPIEIAEYVKVWTAVSKAFKKNAVETNWLGGIARIIEDLVYQEFDSNILLTNLTRNRLNPFIIKLMENCRLRMESELADK